MPSRVARAVTLAFLAVAIASCDDGASLDSDAVVSGFTATPIDMQSIQLRWSAVAGAGRYIVERRANLQGEFEAVVERNGRNQTNYLDRGLEPSTTYGYRLRVINDFGDDIGVSSVAGARTAPEPGIEVQVRSINGGDPRFSMDSSGYVARVRQGTFDQTLAIEVDGTQLFQPLQGGVYQVTLEEVASNCEIEGQQVRNTPVTASGLNTISKVSFTVLCRDRTRGRVSAVVRSGGDSTDADGFRVALAGFASDQSLPDSVRAVVIKQNVGATGGTIVFDNIRPGRYSVTIESVAPFCTVAGKVQRDSLNVEALGSLTETFDVTCLGGGGSGGTGPYTFRAQWEPDTALTNAVVKLATTLDLGQGNPDDLAGFQFDVVTSGGAVHLDSIVNRTPGFSFTSNILQDGATGRVIGSRIPGVTSGVVPLADFFYTVTGSLGRSVRPQFVALSLGSANGNDFTGKAKREVGTFVVGTKQGSSTNEAPVARANGPYTGTAGSPIAFSAAGSTDPDGTIASYSWTFGDGLSATGQSPTHTYQAAGSYQVQLTVTDNRGATAAESATVTVTSGGGAPTTPFTWAGSFGARNPADNTVTLTLTLDLSSDIPETAGVEALQDFEVDSLKWNRNVLQYQGFTFSSGTGFLNFLQASNGKLSFRGTIDAAKSRGLITIATVKFLIVGSAGTSTTTATRLASLSGVASTGFYDYKPRTVLEEGTFTVAGGGSSTTTVSGTVSSQSGPLANVTVSLSGSGGSAVTAANGTYTISNVAAGSYTASVSNLPSGCTAPATQNVTVAASPVTVDFSVTCTTGGSGATVAGTVNRQQGGAGLAGVTVQVTGGPSGVTGASGAYSIANVAAGSKTVSVTTGLPPGCTVPASQTVTVPSTGSVTVNFSVNCPQAAGTGTVVGQIAFAAGSGTPNLAGVQVTVTPTPAGTAAVVGSPNATGAYSVANVMVGSGGGAGGGTARVTGGLPSGCTPANPSASYSGLTAGGTATAGTMTITCPSTSNNYQFTIAFGAISAGKTTMTVKIDMSTRNDPANNGSGPDKIGGFGGTIDYPTSRLSGAACTAGQLTGIINIATAGRIIAVLSNVPAGVTGNNVTIFTCTFNATGTGPSPITISGVEFGDPTGSVDFTAFVDIILDQIP